jgi:hypothetical protein
MKNIIKLGQLTAGMRKQAQGIMTYGNQDPFRPAQQVGRPDLGGSPGMMGAPNMMGAPGEVGDGIPMGTPEMTPNERAGDSGAFGNILGGGLTAATSLTPVGAGFNLGADAIGHAIGGAPSMSDINSVRDRYSVDINKDSFLTALKKVPAGIGWALSNPISAGRMVASDMPSSWGNSGPAKAVGNFGHHVGRGAGLLWDRVANQPMSGPKPGWTKAYDAAHPRAGAPVAPKPAPRPVAKPPMRPMGAPGTGVPKMPNPMQNKPGNPNGPFNLGRGPIDMPGNPLSM